ncbi:PP2C family protein-serine/threonine phosphatase [Streptomyces odontomachi]|uniref:PP2C family protein-serine/threonine phosphatase n=1 Tax=Streptomyces odontomachi TaxID=2944940 RepID=UPI00210C5FD1|nr:PP2C family protein-serine/threonine phosphatase [Streptomyces sp. ODS25]
MSMPPPPKVAGIDSTVPAPAHTVAPPGAHLGAPSPGSHPTPTPPGAPAAAIQDRLAGWVCDLTGLHELTERLARTTRLRDALHELLRAGATLVGARRGLVVLEPSDGLGPDTTVGLGLTHADLGHIETVPRAMTSYGRLLDTPTEPSGGVSGPPLGPPGPPAPLGGSPVAPPTGTPGGPDELVRPDLLAEDGLNPHHREVLARLGCAATYALPLTTRAAGRLGAAVWLYDEPTEPTERRRHLIGLYARHATEHLSRLLELERARTALAAVAEELLPTRLPRIPGVRLAVRHQAAPNGGGDWYDALPLPDGAFGLAVGSVTGSGPGVLAAMGGLRASLRAYAVMEGEDPVAVLSDLELLLRLTEPARSATALFAYCEPMLRRMTLAGAGHTPPLIIGERRTEFVETSLSAPLGMLSCWEAPTVELHARPGETVLLCTDGLLRRTGEPMDRAVARLHAAGASVPAALRSDPGAVADHVLRCMVPGEATGGPGSGAGGPGGGTTDGRGHGQPGARPAGGHVAEADVVVLTARFE